MLEEDREKVSKNKEYRCWVDIRLFSLQIASAVQQLKRYVKNTVCGQMMREGGQRMWIEGDD